MDFDLTLTNGSIIDGSGAGGVRADIGVRHGRIAAIGDLTGAATAAALDVSGLVCAPGFIDAHTHSDLAAFLPPENDSVRLASVRQGVTTEVCGNCGFSPFPVRAAATDSVTRHLGALFGATARTFDGLEQFSRAVGDAGLVNNLVPLVGHGTLRAGVVGFDARPATDEELRAMAGLLDRALDNGAVGLSTGLVYPPAIHAATDELAHLVRVVSKHARIYSTHIRDEMDRVGEAVDEALSIAKAADAAVHISHLKSAGPANRGRVRAVVARLDAAREGGIDVTADLYPYSAGSTMLHSLLPPWVAEGGTDEMLGRLEQPAARARASHDLVTGLPNWQNFVGAIGWNGVRVASAPGHREYEGRSIAALAEEGGVAPIDLVAELLVAEQAAVTIILDSMDEDDVRWTLQWPHTMLGSDGIPTPGKPHPRWAGCFVRMLGQYSRKEGLVPLPEAVRKMTSLPADRFGLRDRGRLEPGAVADIVVLDPHSVSDGATYEDPLAPPQGIHRVIVGGVVVVADGQPTGATPGAVLLAP